MKERMQSLKDFMLNEARRANLYSFENYLVLKNNDNDWFFDVFVLTRNGCSIVKKCGSNSHMCECFIKAWMWDNKIRYVYGGIDKKVFPKTYPRMFVIMKQK